MTIIMRSYIPAIDTQRILDFRRACTTHANIDDYPTIADLYEILNRAATSDQELLLAILSQA